MKQKTVTKNYQGITYTFEKTDRGYKTSDGFLVWYQTTTSVKEAKRKRELA